MSWVEFTTRIMAAAIFGAFIGLERQWRQRRAGLRTNALVSVGSAAFVTVSGMLPGADSTRIAAQVVSGIGFLGAGVILREGLNVRGLNTAATLWCAAAVGTLAGSGFIVPSFIATIMVVGANVLLRPIGVHLNKQQGAALEISVCYRVQATCLQTSEEHVRSLLMDCITSDNNMLLKAIRSEPVGISGSNKIALQADVITPSQHDKYIEAIINRLKKERGVTGLSWELLGDDEVVCNLE